MSDRRPLDEPNPNLPMHGEGESGLLDVHGGAPIEAADRLRDYEEGRFVTVGNDFIGWCAWTHGGGILQVHDACMQQRFGAEPPAGWHRGLWYLDDEPCALCGAEIEPVPAQEIPSPRLHERPPIMPAYWLIDADGIQVHVDCIEYWEQEHGYSGEWKGGEPTDEPCVFCEGSLREAPRVEE